jgi:hypothetical protein
LPLIEQEIRTDYRLKDWDKAFAHISVPAAPWAVWTYFSVMVVAQVIFWIWADHMDFKGLGNQERGGYDRSFTGLARRRIFRQFS